MYVYFHFYTAFSLSSNDGCCYVITKGKIMRAVEIDFGRQSKDFLQYIRTVFFLTVSVCARKRIKIQLHLIVDYNYDVNVTTTLIL